MKDKFILGGALVLALSGGWEPVNADHVAPGEEQGAGCPGKI